jgi:hypothetical protein
MQERSEHQRSASRRNGSRSRGPRTQKGKRDVRLNGLKHGLQASDLILPGESMEDFERLRSGVWSTYEPAGAYEESLASRVVASLWRLQRLEHVECGLFRYRMSQMRQEQLERPLLDFNFDSYVPPEAEQEHAVVVTEQTNDLTLLGRAFATDAGTYLVLARYETTLGRTLMFALVQLENWRAARMPKSTGTADPNDSEPEDCG